MSDIPRRTAARTAKLASLPLGVAGRAAAGWGRRLAGGNSDEISAQMMARSAEQLFAVLGELKGGAMKFGQALSRVRGRGAGRAGGPVPRVADEAAARGPADADPRRPPDARRAVRPPLARAVPRVRRRRRPRPRASGRCTARCGRTAARSRSRSSTRAPRRRCGRTCASSARMSRLLQPLVPGQDVKPLMAELRERMEEELDYRDEAANQRAFAEVFDGDPLIAVPRVVASAPRAMVSEWVSGRKLSEVIAGGTADERDRAGAAARRVPLLRSRPGRPAARRPASGQLPAAARRPAAGAGLRRGRAAARRACRGRCR